MIHPQAGRRDPRQQQLADQRRVRRAERQGPRARPHPDRRGPHRGPGGQRPGHHADRPIPATGKALKKSGIALSGFGVFEVNEAFAPVPLAWLAEIDADPALLNPNGGATALGHPLGGSGARLMTTLARHVRNNGIRFRA